MKATIVIANLLLLGAVSAYAATPATDPSAGSKPTPATATAMHKSRRSCSKDAMKQNLHGQARIDFIKACMAQTSSEQKGPEQQKQE
ncbi:MAG: PsiF family protein [Steroidobacteraceae bacterium]